MRLLTLCKKVSAEQSRFRNTKNSKIYDLKQEVWYLKDLFATD